MSRPVPESRRVGDFDLVVVPVLFLLMGGFVGWGLGQIQWTPTIPSELVPFGDTYGSTQSSRGGEEWLVRDFFGDRRDGVFVDVGANHYRKESNTYYLETALGWSGVAVDPQEQFAADYHVHRPRTRYFVYFVSDRSDAEAALFVPDSNPFLASMSKEFTQRNGHPGRERRVLTIRLTDLLDRARISNVDFLSIDVELAEPLVLAGFDIDRFRPSLVCIEAHFTVRQLILDYFGAHGYKLIGRYLRADRLNLWFAPVDATLPTKLPGA